MIDLIGQLEIDAKPQVTYGIVTSKNDSYLDRKLTMTKVKLESTKILNENPYQKFNQADSVTAMTCNQSIPYRGP